MTITLFILTIQLFCLQATVAQPGDSAFSILTFDENGFVGCDQNNYEFFACSVNYPNSLMRSDSLELVWKPDLKTIKILEPLRLILLKDKVDKELMTFPPQREIQKGQYRLVVYDDIYQRYWTDEFIIG